MPELIDKILTTSLILLLAVVCLLSSAKILDLVAFSASFIYFIWTCWFVALGSYLLISVVWEQ